MSAAEAPDQDPPSETSILAAYQAIVQRRVQRDSLIWQVPALCLTAQAFLLQFALDSSKGPAARATASLLSFFTAITCIQLMARHRIAEVSDSRRLQSIEEGMGLALPVPHAKPDYSDEHIDRRHRAGVALGVTPDRPLARWGGWILYRWGQHAAFLVWACVLAVFAIVGLGVDDARKLDSFGGEK